ncbi:MFS transporter [Arsenicibacter rosenii]|uniref:MFS transporter n=1 Tax=Arsenicibacter rosenii TaxID=1750698 RepID=UPI0009F17BFF|nr:MFS transporter [Arsenicibacter rosenii]
MINQTRLFNASCFALITTAFSFSIRAGILPQLGTDFGLSAEQLGFINSMWFLGFPISMIVGGIIYHSVGPKIIMNVAFVCHTLGILLTIFAGGYSTLLISTLFIGIGNGCTEAACNPMIADMYSGEKMNKMLNRFHMWFPGGIVLGSLISLFMGPENLNLPWQAQIWIIMVPTIVYAFLFFGQTFPSANAATSTQQLTSSGIAKGALILAAACFMLKLANDFDWISLSDTLRLTTNVVALVSALVGVYLYFGGLFLFMFCCMAFTAISEFGPQQWVGLIMSKSGAQPLIILALTTGIMAVGRFFGGPIIHKLDQTGVLLGGSVFATIGIYLFSTQTGAMAYVAAIFFAVGVCYFWPTMVGFVAERIPASGALGMSIIGGVGMFSTSIFQPIIGGWIDAERAEKATTGLAGDALELAAGQATLVKMTTFPIILIVAFTILFIWMRNKKAGHADEKTLAKQPQL